MTDKLIEFASAKAEPVAWMYTAPNGDQVASSGEIEVPFEGWTETPLYASPPRTAEQAVALWQLLDEIDTLDDLCRDNDELFRNIVRKVQGRRFDILSGDEFDRLNAGDHVGAAHDPS